MADLYLRFLAPCGSWW